MKKLFILITIIIYGFKAAAFTTDPDSAKQSMMLASTDLDSLQQQLKITSYDSLKSGIYTQIAAQYLKYDSITNKKIRLNYQTEALNYTYLALHLYSRYNDTLGLRISFTNLARVYRSQKKYSQAKWFILQANSLSRIKNDVPNILSSLMELAAIKMDIKDYNLAMRDLNEALKISTKSHNARAESAVQQSYALLYSRMKNYTKEAVALKRHNFIDDSIRKSEEAHLIAKINAQDSLQSKKKVNTIINKKVYKTSSTKRIASI